MSLDMSRRSFLKGLSGVAVIVALPTLPAHGIIPPDPCIPPSDISAPPGVTYRWVRTALMGEPDLDNLEDAVRNGWGFVPPSAHPDVPATDAEVAIERRGLILMRCDSAEVDLRAKWQAWTSRHKMRDRDRERMFASGYVVDPMTGSVVDASSGGPYCQRIVGADDAIARKWAARAIESGDNQSAAALAASAAI